MRKLTSESSHGCKHCPSIGMRKLTNESSHGCKHGPSIGMRKLTNESSYGCKHHTLIACNQYSCGLRLSNNITQLSINTNKCAYLQNQKYIYHQLSAYQRTDYNIAKSSRRFNYSLETFYVLSLLFDRKAKTTTETILISLIIGVFKFKKLIG